MAADARARIREDRCPGVLRLHRAADGHLARVRLPGGRLSPARLEAVASASQLGNGIVELTSRANLQLRGLPEDAGPELAALLAEAGLFPSPAHDRVRNVIASPLAGRHPDSLADTDPVVEALDRGLCADATLAELPGRFLFAIDDGSRMALGHGADVMLSARDAHTFQVLIGGAAIEGRLTGDAAVGLALAIARAFLAERTSAGSMAWRVAELEDGTERIARRVGVELSAEQALGGREPLVVGRQAGRDGMLAVTALARDGRLEPGAVTILASLTGTNDLEVRVSPWRTLTVPDLAERTCAAVEEGLIDCGLILTSEATVA